MGIIYYKAYTPGIRHRVKVDFTDLTALKAEKKLRLKYHSKKGRNNQGLITIHHRGGGHKKLYRLIDFKREKRNIKAKVVSIEYDPNRSCRIALLHYFDGEKRYILYPENLALGSIVESGRSAPLSVGNALPLEKIPLGSQVHNIEMFPYRGGQIARAAGGSAKILAQEGNFVSLKLPSKEVRLIRKECYATIGLLSHANHKNIKLGKAGRKRWLGIRPKVRGVVMNPCDHPHGGGEGKSPIGRTQPYTPWGKAALGLKTRKKKITSIYILKKNLI